MREDDAIRRPIPRPIPCIVADHPCGAGRGHRLLGPGLQARAVCRWLGARVRGDRLVPVRHWLRARMQSLDEDDLQR